YDLSGVAEASLPGGVSVLAAGRYGYPGPLIHLVAPAVDLDYWDYQVRVDWYGLTLQALGSYDSLSTGTGTTGGGGAGGGGGGGGGVSPQLVIEFHRLQLREHARLGSMEVEAALVGGIDRMALFSGQGVQKLSLAARAGLQARPWSWLMISAG